MPECMCHCPGDPLCKICELYPRTADLIGFYIFSVVKFRGMQTKIGHLDPTNPVERAWKWCQRDKEPQAAFNIECLRSLGDLIMIYRPKDHRPPEVWMAAMYLAYEKSQSRLLLPKLWSHYESLIPLPTALIPER